MGSSTANSAEAQQQSIPSSALAVQLPAYTNNSNVSTPQQGLPDEAVSCDDGDDAAGTVPPSPLNLHSLLNRPFGDVVREIASGFQLKSTAQAAAEQLRYLVVHRNYDAEVLESPALMGHLLAQIREAPGLPAAGSCMAVLAQLARTPEGRARLRVDGVLQPLLRFLSIPDVLRKANAMPALMLLQNMTCDRLCRAATIKAEGVQLLVVLLGYEPALLKQQTSLAAHLAGSLCNLVVADGEVSAPKQAFIKAGGLQLACRVLADWGRYDSSPATLRLRLLLADLGRLQQYTMKLHQTALDACTSARAGHPHSAAAQHPMSASGAAVVAAAAAGAAGTPATGDGTGGPLGSLSHGVGLPVSPDTVAMAGKGIPLGTPRMPASERITTAVLVHGKDLGDGGDEEDTGGTAPAGAAAGAAAAASLTGAAGARESSKAG